MMLSAKTSTLSKQFHWLVGLTVFNFCGLAILVCMIVLYQINKQNTDENQQLIDKLTMRIDALDSQVDSAAGEISSVHNMLSVVLVDVYNPSDALLALEREYVSGVNIESLRFSQDKKELKLLLMSEKASFVTAYLSNIEKSGGFKQVKLDKTGRRDDGAISYHVSLKL